MRLRAPVWYQFKTLRWQRHGVLFIEGIWDAQYLVSMWDSWECPLRLTRVRKISMGAFRDPFVQSTWSADCYILGLRECLVMDRPHIPIHTFDRYVGKSECFLTSALSTCHDVSGRVSYGTNKSPQSF
ncbi:unnamed protein product [Prunus armeniaca]